MNQMVTQSLQRQLDLEANGQIIEIKQKTSLKMEKSMQGL
jgi:hypothetical protein